MSILDAQILQSNVTVYATDYESYAIISNCDKEYNEDGSDIQFSQHSSVWSRTSDIDDDFVDKVYSTNKYCDRIESILFFAKTH